MPRHGFVWVINNYTNDDVAIVNGILGKAGVVYICYGFEVGEKEGTPHLQGYMQLNQKGYKRTTALMKRAHFEAAKGDSDEGRNYCMKEKDFHEYGTYEYIKAPPKQGARTDLAGVKKAIEEGKDYESICDTHFGEAAKYGRFIKERIQARESGRLAIESRAQFEDASLRPWQQDLLNICLADPHPRKIHWIWSVGGDLGKSWMATYLATLHGCAILTNGRKADLAYIWAQKPGRIACFDLSKTNAPEEGSRHGPQDVLYSLAEDMKNGRVVSTKYESMTKFFRVPHVIFFANYEPDYTKWSSDRYVVKNID